MPDAGSCQFGEISGRVRARLALDLDELRRLVGMTYRQLACRTGCARSTLNDALTGRRFPRLETVLAIVRACGGDTATWRRRWVAASRGLPVHPPVPDLRDLLELLDIPEAQVARALVRWRALTQVTETGTVPTMSPQATRPR
ncbi:helix-turn-helix domain-containing protein [Actinophytocola sp. KF-1]